MRETGDREGIIAASADPSEPADEAGGHRSLVALNKDLEATRSDLAASEARIAALEKRLAALEHLPHIPARSDTPKPLAETLNGAAVLFALASAALWHLSTVGTGTSALATLLASHNELAAVSAGISAVLALFGLTRR